MSRVQIGWMNPTTGVMCDCHPTDTSPHANYVPVYREVAGPPSGGTRLCSNCLKPLTEHCKTCLVPCCPGHCPSEQSTQPAEADSGEQSDDPEVRS